MPRRGCDDDWLPRRQRHRRRMARLFPLLIALAASVAAAAVAPVALANMANPEMAGSPLGEPSGALASVRIEEERLTLDLRPLAAGRPARVQAVYSVLNAAGRQSLKLMFLAAALAPGSAAAALDGTPVAVAPASSARVPVTWRPPRSTPGIDGSGALPYAVSRPGAGAFTFTLHVPAGRHTIRVRYLARASATATTDSPTRYWQLGYILAPARQWGGFGGLDVHVLLPPGWRAASQPALHRTGDTLSGTFASLPADDLALTVQAPPPPNPGPGARWLVWPVGLCAAVPLGWLLGRRLGRGGRSAAWALPFAVAVALVWMIAALWAGQPPSVPAAVPASQASWIYGYGQGGLEQVAQAFGALTAGVAVTQGSAALGAWSGRRRRRQAPV